MSRRARSSPLPPPESLHTARLQLRPPREADAAAIFAYASDPRVCRYLAWRRHRSLADTRRFLAEAAAGWRSGAWLNWVIEDDSGVVGTIGAQPGRAGAAIGYVLARSHWGRGYAGEALAAVSTVLLDSCNMPALWALCLPRNVASAKVLERNGFHCDRRLANYFHCPNLDGGKHDVLLYVRR